MRRIQPTNSMVNSSTRRKKRRAIKKRQDQLDPAAE
jgi:hypothetical protein